MSKKFKITCIHFLSNAFLKALLYLTLFFLITFEMNLGYSQPYNPIEINGKWGFTDEKGVLVIDTIFVMALSFNGHGIAPVVDDSGWVYIDTRGKKVRRPFIYDNGPDYFIEGLSRYLDHKKIGFINTGGEIQIKAQFEFVRPFSEGLAAFCVSCSTRLQGEHTQLFGGKWGYIDKQGNIAIPATFDVAYNFENEKAIVVIDGEERRIDKRGNILK